MAKRNIRILAVILVLAMTDRRRGGNRPAARDRRRGGNDGYLERVQVRRPRPH
jgi:hypothetical protein